MFSWVEMDTRLLHPDFTVRVPEGFYNGTGVLQGVISRGLMKAVYIDCDAGFQKVVHECVNVFPKDLCGGLNESRPSTGSIYIGPV